MSFLDWLALRWHPAAQPIQVHAPQTFYSVRGPEGRVRIADVADLDTPCVSLAYSGREWLLFPEEARTLARLLRTAADEAEADGRAELLSRLSRLLERRRAAADTGGCVHGMGAES